MKNYLSIDIGGTNTKFAELNNAGKIIKKSKIDTLHEKDAFLKAIDQEVKRYANEGVKGIAFCAPGKIADTTIHFGGALPFLDGADFAKRYQKLGLPVAVINDGKASVLAENWLGSLKELQNCASITLGTGVGGGIIVNGRLLNGEHFQAGELSFMKLNLDTPNADASDSFGGQSFESFAGSAASAVTMIETVNKKIGNQDTKDGLAAFKAINAHDSSVMPIFEDFCNKVAVLILNVQSVVDLKAIAIGGGISAQPIVVQGINHAYDRLLDQNELVKETLTRPQIVDAKFKNDANLYGALYNLLIKINGEKL